ncbi:major facilitator superfamily domain-containing protein [Aspergillus pseudonomiae]|uniref:Major facilitator superfamily domain-containing protein n=1 Tax=Aspergillus pseudonomiae TaxID=1506151 RepID=A0A5N6IBZ2_9EURO|nr:major facilitator superfamily domain-containing protein [Aspergillus pseudonomiae]KAB8264262.1 major facilitator superfamily domain-containing protein [Aspergillus pseudonomiae]KAE8409109.1 major facilitator superfamily domain-containing protein [Aspergillus pseudonomiae]
MTVTPDNHSGSSSSPPSTLPVEVENEKAIPVQETPAPPPPPNGGLVAWLQVVGAFFLFFNSWGVVNTFGVYQTYYETDLLQGHSPSSISWIGTVQGFLLFLVGVVAGPVFDKGYLKTMIAVGSFLVVFGLMMTSLSTKYYQIFLAHGIAVGIGCAFLFLPSIAIVATYFTTRRAVATGITASGGSIGSVIYPIIFHKLLGPLGFGWTTRIIGFIALGGLCISLAVMRLRLPPPKQTRSLLDLSAFKEAPFLIFSFGLFCAFVGLYFPFFYLPTYMSRVVHSTDDLAFYIIAILNATSVFGRITPGLVADRLGSLNTIIPMGLGAAVLAYAWIGIKNLAGTIVFACLYGFFSGAIVSLPPTIVARLSPNMNIVGTRMGMCFTFAGLGLLIGNPIAGALLDVEKGVFWKAELFSAVMVTAGVAAFVWLRLLKWTDGEKGKY